MNTGTEDFENNAGLALTLASMARRLSERAEEIMENETTVSVIMLTMANDMVSIATRINDAEKPKTFDIKLAKLFIKAMPKILNPQLMEKVNESFK